MPSIGQVLVVACQLFADVIDPISGTSYTRVQGGLALLARSGYGLGLGELSGEHVRNASGRRRGRAADGGRRALSSCGACRALGRERVALLGAFVLLLLTSQCNDSVCWAQGNGGVQQYSPAQLSKASSAVHAAAHSQRFAPYALPSTSGSTVARRNCMGNT